MPGHANAMVIKPASKAREAVRNKMELVKNFLHLPESRHDWAFTVQFPSGCSQATGYQRLFQLKLPVKLIVAAHASENSGIRMVGGDNHKTVFREAAIEFGKHLIISAQAVRENNDRPVASPGRIINP